MIVYEYELNTAHSIFMVPQNAMHLAVGDVGGAVFVYFLGDPHQGLVPRRVVSYRSNMNVEPGGDYIGTVLLHPGQGNYRDSPQPPEAYHVFDYGEVPTKQ